MSLGYPTVGFSADNCTKFRNEKLEELMSKLGLTIDFGPANSSRSNGINKRNHYSCDMIVSKIMDQDKKIYSQEAVTMALWKYNSNVKIHSYTLL